MSNEVETKTEEPKAEEPKLTTNQLNGAVIMDGPTLDYQDYQKVQTPAYTTGAPEPMPWWKWQLMRIGWWFQNLWEGAVRKLPRLVWPDDEIDVRLVFDAHQPLPWDTSDKPVPFTLNFVRDAYNSLGKSGVKFDSMVTLNRETWYLDFSLRGPMRVKFIGKAKNGVLRQGGLDEPEANSLVQ